MYKKKMIELRYVTIMRNFYHLSKEIMKGNIKEVDGKDFDKYYRDADDFVDYVGIEHIRNEAGADSLDLVRARLTTGSRGARAGS